MDVVVPRQPHAASLAPNGDRDGPGCQAGHGRGRAPDAYAHSHAHLWRMDEPLRELFANDRGDATRCLVGFERRFRPLADCESFDCSP